MSWNISYFIETLPEQFNSWNISHRTKYYSDNLYGFSWLNITDQTWIAQWLTSEDLQKLYNFVSSPEDVGFTLEKGINGTVQFLQYIASAEWLRSPTPTLSPQEQDCLDIEEDEQSFFKFMIIPSAILVFLLIFMKRRKLKCMHCCYGRPGVLYPVNFIDEYHRRWAYMAAFAVLAYRVLNIFDGTDFYRPDVYDDPEWTKTWGWTTVLLRIANIGILGLVVYPTFVFLTLRKHIIANILGLAYTIPWLYAMATVYERCSPVEEDNDYRAIGVLQIIFDVPIFIAYLFLCIAYTYDLILNSIKLYERCRAHNSEKYKEKVRKREFFESDPILYLEALFARKEKEPPATLLEKIKRFRLYESVPGFSISTRVLCTMTVASLFLYKIQAYMDFLSRVNRELFIDIYDESYIDLLDMFNGSHTVVDTLREAIDVVYWCFNICFYFSAIVHFLMMIHMIFTYRTHMRKLFRGHVKWHFKNECSPAAHMVAGMRYSGYQIAYIFYGYFLLAVVIFLVCMVVAYLIVIPLRDGWDSPLIEVLKTVWPTILAGLVLYYLQILMAKFCFLQERGLYMALDNRRIYHVASFFLFFFNVILGFFSCLRRVLFSVIFGTLLISRLDRCLLMRGFERFDAGYKAYLGMLEVELFHTHPLLKAFVMVLHEQVLDTKWKSSSDDHVQSCKVEAAYSNGAMNEIKITPRKTYDKRIVIKWWKMVTLVNNPSLILERIHSKIKTEKKNKRSQIIDGIIEVTATAGAGLAASAAMGSMPDDVNFITFL